MQNNAELNSLALCSDPTFSFLDCLDRRDELSLDRASTVGFVHLQSLVI